MFDKKFRRAMTLGRQWSFFNLNNSEWVSIGLKINTEDIMQRYRVKNWEKR